MSHNPKDNQALLQSMLQRLKLQPGRDGQAFSETPAPVTVSSTWGQGGGGGGPDLKNMNNCSVNGFQPAADKGPEGQQPSHCEVDGGVSSFPSQKGENTDEDAGEKRVLGSTVLPDITSTGREHQVPVRSDADVSSFAGSAIGHTRGDEDAVKSAGPVHEQNQGFTPKLYTWSSKSTNASADAGGDASKVANGDVEESKDVSSPITNNSSLRRKQRASENKTRRWTQKIKERWRDKHGSFRKKEKEEGGRMAQKSEQASPQNELLTGGTMITPATKEEELTPPPLHNSDPSNPPPAPTESSSADGHPSDFEFGLGSFSLLEEITMGQEWAKFLNPNLSATSVHQSPSEDPLGQYKVSPSSYSGVQPCAIASQQGGESNQWSFWRTKATPGLNLGPVQDSPDGPLPVSMEVSESKQESVPRRADLTEPMDDGWMQPVDRGLGRQHRPQSFVQTAGILDSSRAQLNRKRPHQSGERLQIDRDTRRERSISAPSAISCQEMGEPEGTQHHNSLYTPQSPTPCSPSALVPRGVLKHLVSQDSEASMETMSKRRRVEENRRVRFSEDVVAIEPPDIDLEAFDSADESGGEEDSVIEQECEVEQSPVEVGAPVRRHALPAWILALKRRKNR